MGEQGSGRGQAGQTRRRAQCKQLLRIYWKFLIYGRIADFCGRQSVWNWTYEQVGFQCRHEPLPANNSGIKVLVYGLAKTGTTSMSRALGRLYENPWRATDASIQIVAPLADEYWQDPKNGGGMFPWQRLATARAPAYLSGGGPSVRPAPKRLPPDIEMLLKVPRLGETLADRFSRCRVETMAFDGMEHLFWPVYEVSPGAKVVMLNWRTYEERLRSFSGFASKQSLFLLAMGMGFISTQVLPHSAVVQPIMDALTDNRLLHHANRGTAWANAPCSWLDSMWRQSFQMRRVTHHRLSGLGVWAFSREDYDGFWAEGKRRIPRERLLEFDMRRNTMKDLCEFLEIRDNPECDSGTLPNMIIIGRSESEQPEQFLVLVPIWLFCHWANWTVVFAVLGWPLRIMVATLRKLFPSKKSSRKLT